MKYKHSSFDIHVSADMTACPWKLNHGDHHVSCFYHCHTHTRFPRRRSNPRHDVPRRGHGSSDVAITVLPCLSFADRWDLHLGVPHVSERMVGLFMSGDPHPTGRRRPEMRQREVNECSYCLGSPSSLNKCAASRVPAGAQIVTYVSA